MTRPLAEPTVDNEFYWSAGADGILRIQECRDCTALIHLQQPVCRYCLGQNMGVRDVSGKAALSAFTVNHRFGFPDLPSTYVIAQAAVVEDARVRMTTKVVRCDPDGLELGQIVEVDFEKIEDVWSPISRPSADTPRGPMPEAEIAAQNIARHMSPPLTTQRFEERSAITGIGASRLGRRLMVTPLSQTTETCEAPVANAGLTLDDIDGLSTYLGLDVAGMGEGGVATLEVLWACDRPPEPRAGSCRSARRRPRTRSRSTRSGIGRTRR